MRVTNIRDHFRVVINRRILYFLLAEHFLNLVLREKNTHLLARAVTVLVLTDTVFYN